MAETQATSVTVAFTLKEKGKPSPSDPWDGPSQAELKALLKEVITREFAGRGFVVPTITIT